MSVDSSFPPYRRKAIRLLGMLIFKLVMWEMQCCGLTSTQKTTHSFSTNKLMALRLNATLLKFKMVEKLCTVQQLLHHIT